jgi:hypothetical protein
LADDNFNPDYGKLQDEIIQPWMNAPPVRRSYQPTYQEPIPEPRRQMNSYELDNAIRQIPGWNKQFPNYGR